eukprot:scpid106378/ scgid3432/ 
MSCDSSMHSTLTSVRVLNSDVSSFATLTVCALCQVLCRKIFIGTKTQVGLLWSAPVRIRHKLHLLLTECSDYTATTDTRLMTERLRTLLLEELNPRKRTQRQKAL